MLSGVRSLQAIFLIKTCKLLWSILKVIFKTDPSFLLISFCIIESCFVHVLFPVLIFCFYLYFNSCLAREFTYCHIRNVIRLALSDVGFLKVLVFVVLELTLVLWYLSVATVRRLIYSLTIATGCCNVSDKIYNRNSTGQLTQTRPTLAIKTATLFELVSREE